MRCPSDQPCLLARSSPFSGFSRSLDLSWGDSTCRCARCKIWVINLKVATWDIGCSKQDSKQKGEYQTQTSPFRPHLEQPRLPLWLLDLIATDLDRPHMVASPLWSLLPLGQPGLLGWRGARSMQSPLCLHRLHPQCDQLLLCQTGRGASGSSSLQWTSALWHSGKLSIHFLFFTCLTSARFARTTSTPRWTGAADLALLLLLSLLSLLSLLLFRWLSIWS